MKKTRLFLLFLGLLLTIPVTAQNDIVQSLEKLQIEADGLPKKPSLSVQKQHSVYDYAQLMSPEQRRMLEQKISKYYDTTSTQIVVASVNKVNDDISLYATEWAHKWGIGQKDKGNGVFILISKDDHKVTIRTGYGVEHLLTDALSKRIITNDMIPYFRKGQFYEGLNKAIDDIIKVLAGEYHDKPKPAQEGIPVWVIILIIIIFIIVISAISNGGSDGGGSWRSSGGGPIIFSSSGRSSWGGSSWGGGGSFGGGFSGGFGGGGFGGGGATGGW